MILRAYEEKAAADLMFVPTFIGYDQVPGGKGIPVRSWKGREKEKESVGQLMQAQKIFEEALRPGLCPVQRAHLLKRVPVPGPECHEEDEFEIIRNHSARPGL